MTKTATKPNHAKVDDDTPVVSTIGPSIVLKNVLNILGKPENMSKIVPSLTRATPVTQDTFRVNIYTQVDKGFYTADTLTHSFFVRVDNKGKVVHSNPEIIKKYE